MTNEQEITNEAIAEAVAEVTRVAIQVTVAATADRIQSVVGPIIGGPAMKQPTFNWEANDEYSKLKNIRLEVNNIITSYNTPNAGQLVMSKAG